MVPKLSSGSVGLDFVGGKPFSELGVGSMQIIHKPNHPKHVVEGLVVEIVHVGIGDAKEGIAAMGNNGVDDGFREIEPNRDRMGVQE